MTCERTETTATPDERADPPDAATPPTAGGEEAAVLRLIPLDQLTDHPDHPRLALRGDVVTRRAAGMRGAYPREHAIRVRPLAGGYQVLDGRHAVAAARLGGLGAVWAWVKEWNDEDAFMQLVEANTHTELDPLEIGLHARKAVRRALGGRGRKGGVSAYAARLGLGESYVRQLVRAAEVFLETSDSSPKFLGKARHLAEVHRAHRSVWSALAALVVEKGWSVRDTEAATRKVAGLFGEAFDPTAGEWWGVFLPPDQVARELAMNSDFTPAKVTALRDAADATAVMLAGFGARGVDTSAREAGWRAWLAGTVGGESWNPRRHDQWRDRMRNELEGLAPTAEWHPGDWREHIDKLADGGVAAVVTDPPFGTAYQSGRRADPHAPIVGDESVELATAELAAALDAVRPKLKPQAHVFVFCDWESVAAFAGALGAAGIRVRSHAVWVKDNHGAGDLGALGPQHELILHATLGDAALYHRRGDVFAFPKVLADRHPTEKPQPLIEQLIEISTVRGDLIADPFGGVATTATAAKATGRGYWSCEVDPGYWAAGDARLAGG